MPDLEMDFGSISCYFYGETPLNHKLTWTGEMRHWFEGRRYPFFKVDMGTAMNDFTQSFTCE